MGAPRATVHQSTLSKYFSNALESEKLEDTQLPDDVLEYFAGMLTLDGDEAMSDDEIVSEWAPYLEDLFPALQDDASTMQNLCKSVLVRLQSCSGPRRLSTSSSVTPPVSREISPQASVQHSIDVDTSQSLGTIRAPVDTADSNAEPPQGLAEWLARLSLLHHLEGLELWCRENGAAELEEVMECWSDFCDDLGLKYFERRRVERYCEGFGPVASNQAVKPETSSPDIEAAACDVPVPAQAACADVEEVSSGDSPVDGLEALESSPPLELERGRAAEGETFGPEDDPYTILQELGHGVTATVYMCSRGGKRYAVKVIGLRRYNMRGDRAGMLKRLHRESSILYSLHHSHIVSLYEVFETPAKLYFVMELVEGGELCNLLMRQGALPEHEARYIFLQIVLGLRYMHSKGVAHRDLKPENVLINSEASRPGLTEVKISDFGQSKFVQDGYTRGVTRVGTPLFWAPEVADSRVCAQGYDERVDLWSLGVVLHVMLEGKYPENSQGGAVQFTSDSKLSRDAKHLVRALMQQRADDRISLDACLRHSWVTTAKGPLSRILSALEDHSMKTEWERVVPLPGDPMDVGQLRCELQDLTTRLKRPLTLRHRNGRCEVGVDFSDGSMSEADWDELMDTLEFHFPAGMFHRPDINSLESNVLGVARLARVPEDETASVQSSAASGNRCLPEDMEKDLDFDHQESEEQEEDSVLHLHDLDLQLGAAKAAFPESVEVPVGDLAPVPRWLDVRLFSAGHSLELRVLLPEGYPRHCAAQLGALSVRWSRGQHAEEQLETLLRARIVARLRRDSRDESLVDFVEWLHQEIPQVLSASAFLRSAGTVSSGMVAGAEEMLPALPKGSCQTDSSLKGLVKCCRCCLLVTSHDDFMDVRSFGSHDRRGDNPKLKGPRRESFFLYLKKNFPAITGILSFGRPGVLIAEGPLEQVENVLSEIHKFPPWKGHVQQKLFGVTEPLMDVRKWRSFESFAKVRTEDLQQVLEKAGHQSLYESIFAESVADSKRADSKKVTKRSFR